MASRSSDLDASEKARRRRRLDLLDAMMIWAGIWWKLAFATVAILDLISCWDTLYMGWTGESSVLLFGGVCPVPSNVSSSNLSSSHSASSTSFLNASHGIRQSTCHAAYSLLFRIQLTANIIREKYLPFPLHGLFCILCLIEMVIRAFEARRLAIELEVIASFEESLSKVYSTTRLFASSFQRGSMWRMGSDRSLTLSEVGYGESDQPGTVGDGVKDLRSKLLARSTLRLWIPVGVTCFFWLSILPRNPREYFEHATMCGTDSAIATEWTTTIFAKLIITASLLQEKIVHHLWEDIVMPYNAVSQPLRFWKRVRQLLRLIRLVRFAGPFMRMSIKLSDQLFAMLKTRRQALLVREEKEKRVRRPSLLFQDLQKIEAIAKVQTRLASLPSQLFEMAQDHFPTRVAVDSHKILLQQRKKYGRYIKKQLKSLHEEMQKSFSAFSSGDVYDRITKLIKDINNISQRTHKQSTLSHLLQSPDLLISPRSRFSVVWRLTVTNCLSMELTRLALSWYLTKNFQLSITQIISRLFIHCKDPKDTQKHLRFLTDHFDNIHKALSNAIPLIPFEEKWIVCVPTSISASIFLQLGFLMETFIDVVSFLDIFFWFFTGELDEFGLVVPKQFFSRCIVPGTLVQVLDHPTLPQVLPTILKQAFNAAIAIGWSRAMRWMFAIGPAFYLVIVQPMNNYFFRHFDDGSFEGDESNKDVLMKAAESVGYLPRVPTSRNALTEKVTPGHRRTKSPTSLSSIHLQEALNAQWRAMPEMARSTPSTLSTGEDESNHNSRNEYYDDDINDNDGVYFEEDSDVVASSFRAMHRRGLGYESTVRFARDVHILDRLDSSDTSDHRSSDESRHNNLNNDDSISFDIGYSVSARDLTSMEQEEECD